MSIYKRKRRKVKPPQVKSEDSLYFAELLDILSKVGIEVRVESGYFNSGLCLLEDRHIYFLNRNLPIEQNIDLLLDELKTLSLGNIYIPPRIRAQIGDMDLKKEEQK